jgi:non-homologous end joining protein Ku/predicted RNase H-like HicB family nuclease
MHVVAMIHQEGAAFGVSFPDFPGCTTVGNDLETAVAQAAEVLAFHAEGLAEDGALPRPRSLTELNSDPDFLEDRKDALLILVPYEPPTRAIRINMTVEESLLARIDRAAEAAGETRSAYFARAARLRMATTSVRPRGRQSLSPGRTWTGMLKFSLVSCPIVLSAASDDTTDSQQSRSWDIEGPQTIDLSYFVPRREIDFLNVGRSFLLAPAQAIEGQEAFAVIREVMSRTDMMGIGYVMTTFGKRPIAVGALANGMRAMTLLYADDLRNPDEFFSKISDIHVSDEMINLAKKIINSKATRFDPTTLERDGEVAPASAKLIASPRDSNVINLIDALKRSVGSKSKQPADIDNPTRRSRT